MGSQMNNDSIHCCYVVRICPLQVLLVILIRGNN